MSTNVKPNPIFASPLALPRLNQVQWLPSAFPTVVFIVALGVLMMLTTHTAARLGERWVTAPFWLGLLIIYVPVAVRMLGDKTTRNERVALVILLAVALYLTKVGHGAITFTHPDEMSQLHDSERMLLTGHLFSPNPQVIVTPYYPGLPIVTNELLYLGGLSIHGAGMTVMAFTRVVLMLGLFLLYERISGSSRAAGLGVLIYATNSSYLYYSAEFSYESLALPFMVTALWLIAWREYEHVLANRAALTLTLLPIMFGMITSHHVTNYMFMVIVAVSALCFFISPQFRKQHNYRPVGYLVVVSIILTLTWVAYISLNTVNYLTPIFTGAVDGLYNVIFGERVPRQLFVSSDGYQAPLYERVFGLGSVALVCLGQLIGLRIAWLRKFSSPMFVALFLYGCLYAPMLVSRFSNTVAWEASSRSTQFVFIGLGATIALVLETFVLSAQKKWLPAWLRITSITSYLVFIFIGGLLSGWPVDLRMARPTEVYVNAGTTKIEPQGIVMSRWTRENLGTSHRIILDYGNSNLITAYGLQVPQATNQHGIQMAFKSPNLGESERDIMASVETEYAMADQRTNCCDVMKAVFFPEPETTLPVVRTVSNTGIDTRPLTKFDNRRGVDKLLDSGYIALYDIRRFVNRAPAR